MWYPMNDACDTCKLSLSRKRASRAGSESPFLEDKTLSPVKNEDMSLFDGVPSAPVTCTSGSPGCPHRRTWDDMDPSSQDSGFHGELARFNSYGSPSRGLLSSSFGSVSVCSIEDDFLEDFADIEPLEKQPTLQEDLKLTSVPLAIKSRPEEKSSPKDTIIRPLFRRALSLQNTGTFATPSKVRTSLFGLNDDNEDNKENKVSFKRTEPPTDLENKLIKRSKFFKELSAPHSQASRPMKALFKRQFSATEESIMCAVKRSSDEPDLIGDFSKSYCLPLTPGRHQDLKSITAETLVKLMKGEFGEKIESFKIVDCRYPYEFVGGHIKGALNIYTKEQINELLQANRNVCTNANKRHILVFHCEFSSERGPNLYRYLRKEDRTKNMSDYPALHYPEIYLLEGGYKSFYQQFADLCVPIAYKEMLHPDHEEDLRHFRQKSKTWNADTRQRPARSLKRL
ncbi:unnamed protein product [Ceutorhynchus assimilis]|uniref:protein-tyrosine-phosphatase n=1 Tax=Ceutorhynchus assimilis TaxID=467358 RepID=A0A9N9MD53_9CUCU|nr:unnamed protein product [Ceutorhynchus assimilis]